MAMPTEIPKKNILKEVMRAVRSALKEILATMDLMEEIKNPLPKSYFLLLQKKIDDGITIKRLAFGTKAEFMAIKKRHAIKDPRYQMRLAKTRMYKRMILIDRQSLFFAMGDAEKRKFFFASDPPLIKKFSRYFMKGFLKK